MTQSSNWSKFVGLSGKLSPSARTWYGTGTEAAGSTGGTTPSTDFERDMRRPAESAGTRSLQYAQEPQIQYPTFNSQSSSGTPSAESGARRSPSTRRQSTSPAGNHELSEFLPRRAADSSSSSPPNRHSHMRPGREEDEDSLKCGDLCHCGPHCAPLAIGGILCLTLSTLAACKCMC